MNFITTTAALISSLCQAVVSLQESFLRELCSHTRCTNIIPVESSCDSTTEPLCKSFKHNDYSDIFPVRQSCDSAKEPLCEFFKRNVYNDIFPVRQSCDSAKSPFCEILKCNPHTQKAVCKSQ